MQGLERSVVYHGAVQKWLETYVDPLCLLKISAHVSPPAATDIIIEQSSVISHYPNPHGALSLKPPPITVKLQVK